MNTERLIYKILVFSLHVFLPSVRELAAYKLGARGDRDAILPLLTRLDDPVPSVRAAVATALAALGAQNAITALLRHLEDSDPTVRIAIARGLRSLDLQRAEIIESLQTAIAKEQPSIQETVRIIVDRGAVYAPDTIQSIISVPNPVYDEMQETLRVLRAVRTKAPIQATNYRGPVNLNRELVQVAINRGRVHIERIHDPDLRDFLNFLKNNDLRDIVLMGGAIRDIFFDETPYDLDVTLRISLTDEEAVAHSATASPASYRIYNCGTRAVKDLSKALETYRSNFQKPYDSYKKLRFHGLDVQYAGPVEVHGLYEREPTRLQEVFIKRFFVDSKTRRGYSSNTTPALLQMAMDYDGALYGQVESLEDLLDGKVSLVGDGSNFTIRDAVRLLRLKHQFGLAINAEDWNLVQSTCHYGPYFPVSCLDELIVLRRLVKRLLDTAIDRHLAEAELEHLGILRLLYKRNFYTG
jgi:2-hydroxy-3-keto-5-methylthiopentenyl-1-phosphate phosphatase